MLFSSNNPPGLPKTLKVLLLINVAAFAVDVLTSGVILRDWFSLNTGLVRYTGQVWRIATYMFLHEIRNPFHILFNMLLLWMFGMAIINTIGEKKFLSLYLWAGVFAGAATFLVDVMTQNFTNVIGASGAVLAIVVLFAFYYPNQELWFWGLFPIKAKWLVAIIVGIDILFLSHGDQIAHVTHLGGALYGALYFFFTRRGSFGGGAWRSGKPGLVEKWKEKSREKREEKSRERESEDEEKLDDILKKISTSGVESLSSAERKTLDKFSARKKEQRAKLIDWESRRRPKE